MDFNKLMSFAADVHVEKVRTKVFYEKNATSVKNPLVDDKQKKGKGINSPSVQAFLKKQEMQEKLEKEQLMAKMAAKKKRRKEDHPNDKRASASISSPPASAAETSPVASFRPTDVVTGKRQRVGITGSSTTATKRAAAIMGKRPSSPLANASNTNTTGGINTSGNGSISRSSNAKNSCLVRAEDSNKHTARVKAAQTKTKYEPANGKSEKSRHRHRKDHKKDSKHNKDNKNSNTTPAPPPKRPVIKMKKPPTQSFDEILQMAREKLIQKPSDGKTKKTKEDPNRRPMTQEEKDREERRNSKSYKDWLKYGNMTSKPGQTSMTHPASATKPSKPPHPDTHRLSAPTSSKHCEKPPHASANGRLNATDSNGRLQRPDNNGASMARPRGLSRQSEQQRLATERLLKAGAASSTSTNNGQSTSKSAKSAYQQNSASGQGNVSTWDRITSGMKKSSNPGHHSKRHAKEESDSYSDYDDGDDYEEDSDLDDFINDEPDGTDVSSHIRQIFGYDRKKFSNESDDTRGMETGYHQLSKEESKSARMGRAEDLADIKADEEYYKAKKKRMKRGY